MGAQSIIIAAMDCVTLVGLLGCQFNLTNIELLKTLITKTKDAPSVAKSVVSTAV
ncbi:MAG: hypothetical protein KUG82_12255 [Pseudomonadales bacterium]|nr:hypothetical protein [Pseudomonadales bacterium]